MTAALSCSCSLKSGESGDLISVLLASQYLQEVFHFIQNFFSAIIRAIFIIGSSLQPNCNREGFNVVCGVVHQRVRIGMTANDNNDCDNCDSSIGLGGDGVYGRESCGNVAKHGGDNGDRNSAAWGCVFVQ